MWWAGWQLTIEKTEITMILACRNIYQVFFKCSPNGYGDYNDSFKYTAWGTGAPIHQPGLLNE